MFYCVETRYPVQGILSQGFTQQHQQLKATTSLNKETIFTCYIGFGTRAHGGVSEAGHKDRGKIKIPWNLVTYPGVGRQKANSMIGFLKRNSRSAPQAAKETAYKTFVPPTVEYTTTSWALSTKSDNPKIEMVQERVTRFVTNDYNRTSSVTEMITHSTKVWRPC